MKNFILLFFCFTLWTCEKKEIDIDITTSSWEIVSIKKSGQVFFDKAKERYTLEFTNDLTYILTLDVNNCRGVYTIPTNGKIIFETPGCTKVCCDSDYAEILLELMPKMTEYYIRGDVLKFTGNGQIELRQL